MKIYRLNERLKKIWGIAFMAGEISGFLLTISTLIGIAMTHLIFRWLGWQTLYGSVKVVVVFCAFWLISSFTTNLFLSTVVNLLSICLSKIDSGWAIIKK